MPSLSGEGEAAPARPALHLRRLVVTDFRSYERTELALDGRPVVLAGANGAGKTNLLEAISLFTPGRGLRGAPYAELARKTGAGGWAAACTADGPMGESRLGTGIEPGAGAGGEVRARLVRIDGETQSGSGALAHYMRQVWLTPAMDRLFVESAGGRRRFLDRLVMGFDPSHGTRVNAYERAMRERNRLLADGRMDNAWLTGLEEQMAEHGVAMAAARVETVARLKGAIAVTSEGAFPKADLSLDGFLEQKVAEGAAVDAEDELIARLKQGRLRDQAAGRTLEGPHRSDLLVRHAPKDMEAAACSTGEQKALLLGLVLANARLLARQIGAAPILLLDEVAAHLDAHRRAALFDEIVALGAQAFMTGTDKSLFESLGTRAQSFDVSEGVLAESAL